LEREEGVVEDFEEEVLYVSDVDLGEDFGVK